MPDIRACVLSPDYKTAWTWLSDESIWQFYRDTGYERQRSARANTLALLTINSRWGSWDIWDTEPTPLPMQKAPEIGAFLLVSCLLAFLKLFHQQFQSIQRLRFFF